MKVKFLIVFSVFFIAAFSPLLYGAELEAEGTPLRKLQRGFLNIALAPMEVAHGVSTNKRAEHVLPTWLTGLGRGSIFAVGRVLTGVYEMITFPVALPDGYEPVVYPEFAWQHFESGQKSF